MTETDQQKQQEKLEQESPLYTERGTTNIADRVVSQIVDMAVNEIQGIRPGKTSTHAGKYEVAVDFDMEVEFGRDLTDLTSALRTRISEQIWRMTGLRVIEQNVKVTDIFFPKAEREQQEQQEEEKAEREETGDEEEEDESRVR